MAEADEVRPIELTADSARGLLPRRDQTGHKGTFGTVVCVCGSLDYAGAGLLSAMSAARGGAGLVTLAVPASLQPIFAGKVPEATTLGLTETELGDIDPAAAGHAIKDRGPSAIVVGSGIREGAGYAEFVVGLIARQGAPVVVDGGGLNLLAQSGDWWSSAKRDCVLTPHPGEFARLTGTPVGPDDGERLHRCREVAAKFGQVVVLKGARTVISAPDGRTAVSPFANAALATAGSGDVLAGLIGALMAQGVTPFEAACLGVYLHGRAGERLSMHLGDAGVLASDIAHELPATRHELSQHSR